MDSAFFSPLEVEEVLEAMTEVEESAVWGSTDSRGGNDLVNVALVVKKGSLVRKEEVVAKVAATLHPRKQITGQVNCFKRPLANIHRSWRYVDALNCSKGGFPRQNTAQPTFF